ncbi:MAG: TonB-dependent receptor [Caulobacterales bacterium]|nr:TonB-dependent receptor [Caulobacterales bacterium]
MVEITGRRRMTSLLAGVSALAAPIAGATAAAAQESAAPVAPDQIIVTATRRETGLQETPISITAFSGDELDARSMLSLADVGDYTPNMTFNEASEPGGGSSAQVFLRGIGQQDYLITSDPGVGIYANGVYLGRTTAGVLALNDLERVEVLRGPQGDLFGRNTIGGAINVVAREPVIGEVEGFAEVGAGADSRFDYSGALNIPLGQSAAARVSVSGLVRDGYGSSTETDIDYGDDNNHAVRAQLLTRLSDNLELLFAGDYYMQDENGAHVIFSGAREGYDENAAVGLYNAFVRPFLDPTLPANSTDLIATDPFVSSVTGPSSNDSDSWGVSAKLTYDANIGEFKSITAYRGLDYDILNDNDGVINDISRVDDHTSQRQFSQEFQLVGDTGPLDWLFGVFYFHEEAEADTFNWVFTGRFDALEALPVTLACIDPATAPPPCATDPTFGFGFAPGGMGNPFNANLDIERYTRQEITVDNYGVFSRFDYDVTDRLRGTLGLRYSYEEKDYFTFTDRLASNTQSVAPTNLSDSWGSFTPRVGLDFQASDDLFLYASAARGFRSGTFNGRASGQETVNTLDPEDVWSYEAGLKSTLAAGLLRFNLTGFYSDYKDIQLLFVNEDNQQEAVNAGTAEIYGVEAELFARPGEMFTLGANIGYLSTELQDVPEEIAALDNSFADGMELSKSSDWTVAVFGQIDVPLGTWAETSARLDYSYRSEFFQRPVNEEIALEPGYALLNARGSLSPLATPVTLSVYGTNLTDEIYNNAIIVGGTGAASAYPARGREWGVSARYQF